MKFAVKIFAVAYVAVVVTFGLGGCAMLEAGFQQSLAARRQQAASSNDALCAAYHTVSQAGLPSYLAEGFRKQVSSDAGGSTTAVGELDDLQNEEGRRQARQLEAGSRWACLMNTEAGWTYEMVSCLQENGQKVYVETTMDLTDLYDDRAASYRLYRGVLLAVALASSGLLALTSARLARPLGRVSEVARRIAWGELSQRVPVGKGQDEVALLARDFNQMADAVETQVAQLEAAARRQQDFVGNFTHELKTPLTSIIGYADMLRSYDLPAAERREAAEYIYREGRRLESLSLHLLDLLVLEKTECDLQPVQAEHLCAEVEQATGFLAKKYGVALSVRCQPALILVEPTLVKTLLYNLVDNACKASTTGQKVVLRGRVKDGRYELSVRDYGRGMAPEELSRITEPFYMVDKSRARSQGGAGLGLALCKRIAALHGSPLAFASRPGEGTLAGFAAQLAPEKAGPLHEEVQP